MTAQRAAEVGLCTAAVAPDELASAETRLVRSILNGSRAALAQTKKHVIHCAGSQVLRQLDESVELSAIARRTDDAREGLQAFLEKRKARWIPSDD